MRYPVAIIFLLIFSVYAAGQSPCLEKQLGAKTYRKVIDLWVPLELLDNQYPCFTGNPDQENEKKEYQLAVRAYIKDRGFFPSVAIGGDYNQNLLAYQAEVAVFFDMNPFFPQPVYTLNAQRDAEMYARWKDEWMRAFPARAALLLTDEQVNAILAVLGDACAEDNSGGEVPGNFQLKANGADECSGAVSLTVGTSCTFSGDYTNASATKSTGMTNPGCYFTTGTPKDIWFTFTMPSSGIVTVQTQAGTAPAMSDGTLAYYTGSCAALVYKNCDDDSGPGSLPQITITEPAGTTIFLRYWGYNSSSGNTQFCVVDACPGMTAPVSVTGNLSPASASSATNVTFSCTAVNGGSCSGNWEYQFETVAGVIKQAWSTASSYVMTSVNRDTAMIIRVRCSSCTSFVTSSSALVFDYLVPPANDACASATLLSVNTWCDVSVKRKLGDPTNDPGVPAPGCGGYAGGDVWFTAVVPASGNLMFDTDTLPNASASNIGGNHLSDLGMAIYSGSCGSLSLLACDDDNSANGANPEISLSGRTPGETLYIRVWDKNNDEDGYFNICATDGLPIDPGQQCQLGYTICSNSTIGGNADGMGTNELTSTNKGCFTSGTEHQSTWYAFSPVSSGTIGFVLTPANGTDDYDFAIWGPYPAGSTLAGICPPTAAPLRCSWFNGLGSSNCYLGDCNNTGLVAGEVETSDDASGVPTGTYKGCVAPITVAAGDVGKVYIMLIDNWSATTSPYSLNWTFGGGCSLSCTLLPVVFGGMQAACDNGMIQIDWSSYSEHDNDHFTLYRVSASGNADILGTVAGAGESNEFLEYTFKTPVQLDDNELIKLTQTDFDGRETLLGYTTSACQQNEADILSAFYDRGTKEVFIEFMTAQSSNCTFSLVLTDGRVISSREIFSQARTISNISLPAGAACGNVVIIRMQSANGEVRNRIVTLL